MDDLLTGDVGKKLQQEVIINDNMQKALKKQDNI